jgi:hypothetical protein
MCAVQSVLETGTEKKEAVVQEEQPTFSTSKMFSVDQVSGKSFSKCL